MTVVALPTSAIAGAVYLAVFAAGTLVALLVASWRWPWTTCSRCHGSGRFRSPSRRHWRDCPHCDGSGRRTRPALRVFKALRRKGEP